jgi:hypothetical protein
VSPSAGEEATPDGWRETRSESEINERTVDKYYESSTISALGMDKRTTINQHRNAKNCLDCTRVNQKA